MCVASLVAIRHVRIDLLESFDAMEMLIDYDGVWGAFGLHPHSSKEYSDAIEERIKKNMKHPKTVAWGECGLDFFKVFKVVLLLSKSYSLQNISPQDVQRNAFARQMKCAIEVNKPLVVHTRDAEEDTLRLMTEILPKDWHIHVHCFSGSADFAKKLMDHFDNLFIGFTGAITFKSAQKTRDVVKIVPLERILLETDGPFMAPVRESCFFVGDQLQEPFRGQVAHPGHIPLVARMVAQVQGRTTEEVLKQAAINTKKMYNLP